MIEVSNLVKRYGDHIAVDNLSFTVEKGQVLGFLGPNGAGKSTTMNIITGYISATEGTVTVNGLDVYEEPEEVKKMIGYLPEFPPLYPEMTVAEYLSFVADIKKVKKNEKKQMIADIMESTKITPMAGRLIKHLSKGYKQRVGLAQAIMGYPELIILDEPTVGLDPKQINEIRDLIRELSKNHTIILSSHIMQEVSAVCDTILIIDKGKPVLIDKPEKLSEHFGDTGGLNLTVRGNREVVLVALNKIDRITKVEEKESIEEGCVNLIVYCNDKEDIREEVFYAMCEAGTPILEMKTLRMSLEDIFLRVTDNVEIHDEEINNDQLHDNLIDNAAKHNEVKHYDAIPEDAIPEDVIPEDVIPEDAIPEDATYNAALHDDIIANDEIIDISTDGEKEGNQDAGNL
ncbi:MAG TPA: ATP-binding cassette domain-containing protein [Mobilitalea sp.]|nr:ATP-binding cassette domain-containing protein [Mobilitalea sp.]